MSVTTTCKGLAELEARDTGPDGELTSWRRKTGGGRKRLSETGHLARICPGARHLFCPCFWLVAKKLPV